MEYHEVANIFPLMDGENFNEFKEDIRRNGQIHPIVTYQGKIVDGRNRYRACQELGIEPMTREWDGKGSLLAFVASHNLYRRHLNAGQRAAIGADMMPRLQEEAKERQKAAGERGREGGRGHKRDDSETLPENIPGGFPGPREAREEAARLSGSNPRYIQDMLLIKKRDPALAEDIKQGKAKFREALETIRPKAMKARAEGQTNGKPEKRRKLTPEEMAARPYSIYSHDYAERKLKVIITQIETIPRNHKELNWVLDEVIAWCQTHKKKRKHHAPAQAPSEET